MDHSSDNLEPELLAQVAGIVSAYVTNNPISPVDLPNLIASTHSAIRALLVRPGAEVVSELNPAVPIKKSVMPDYIVCLDDGKKFKSLKRHLTGLGMTPEQYRSKWALPSTYPMVAPNYSSARSLIAKTAGLGRKPAETAVVPTKRTRKSKAD